MDDGNDMFRVESEYPDPIDSETELTLLQYQLLDLLQQKLLMNLLLIKVQLNLLQQKLLLNFA